MSGITFPYALLVRFKNGRVKKIFPTTEQRHKKFLENRNNCAIKKLAISILNRQHKDDISTKLEENITSISYCKELPAVIFRRGNKEFRAIINPSREPDIINAFEKMQNNNRYKSRRAKRLLCNAAGITRANSIHRGFGFLPV